MRDKRAGHRWLRWAAVLGVSMLVVEGAAAASVAPTVVAGNPMCTELGYQAGFRIDPPNPGTYTVEGTQQVTLVSADGIHFDWSATFGVDAVIAKGGPNANLYAYVPEALADTNLQSPDNASGGPAALSHVDFCYDREVSVAKDATTSYTRTWTWTIDKAADQGWLAEPCEPVEAPNVLAPECPLQIPPGGSVSVNYNVVVTPDAGTDSGWAVAGTITVENDWGVAATLTSVADVVSEGIPATLNCGVTFPYVLAAGATLQCTYDAALPDATQRLNTATVTTTGAVGGGVGTADVVFGDPTTLVDACVDVSDTYAGALGVVCADDGSTTFSYSRDIEQPEACTTEVVENIATFVTDTTGTTGSDGATVYVDKQFCDDYDEGDGCTLTLGYWKTHSLRGPAPYDDAWLAVGAQGADTPFFGSGKTWYQVLWTPPAGNAYFNLAHQYIAAKLNVLNGADATPEVAAALGWAETYFAGVSGTTAPTGALRQTVLQKAALLDRYNNGLIGPGHCSE